MTKLLPKLFFRNFLFCYIFYSNTTRLETYMPFNLQQSLDNHQYHFVFVFKSLFKNISYKLINSIGSSTHVPYICMFPLF